MIRKMRRILAALLVLVLCVSMNTVFAEGTVEHAKEEQSVLLQNEADDADNHEEAEVSQNPVELEGDENVNSSGKTEFPEESEIPAPTWKKGWNLYEDNWYYAKDENTLYYGWIYLKSKWYYLDEANAGIMACAEVKEIGGRYYVFDGNGVMQTGWTLRPEGWYYADTNGACANGWRKLRNIWYYLDGDSVEYPGLMVENCTRTINGSTYFFAVGGAMQTGWVHSDKGWYYADSNGSRATGWRKVKGIWYYLDGDNAEYPGLMLSDCSKEINGNTYTFRVSGAMATGWYQNGNDWYYYDASGLVASGWRSVKGYWYYLDPADNNKMVAYGWKVIDDNWYYFYGNGAMATKWLSLNGIWYWFAGDGAMKTGWQVANSTWYYLYTKNDTHGGSEGAMAKNTVIDGYVVHENGAYIRSKNKLGWQNPEGYPQVSSLTVKLPSYCTGYFTYVTPSRISIYATRQECVDAFIARAYEYLGTKYIEPWSSYPGDAVDCSGFVLQCLYATGMDLGIYNPYNHRWIASQTYNSMNWYHNNTFMPVSTNSLQRGDLVYYRGHVAIYLGNGQIIDSWPGQGVSVKPIGSRGKVIGAARPYV